MDKISWFTPQSNDTSGERWYSLGYQNAALENIRALNELGIAVFYNKEEIPYHINFCQPVYYQTGNYYTVGYTPWESTSIPSSWFFNMSLCDEIWTTSNFVKQVYLDNGVSDNVHVVHHGVSPDFRIVDREITGQFNFLHVGGESTRKNSQLAVDAFLELYDGNEDYKLVLKYNNFCNAEVPVHGTTVSAINHPQILGLSDSLPRSELFELYSKCHCMLYPTKGEGFGMIPFEAIATGMPTIVTNATGTADFAEMSYPLNATMVPASEQSEHYGTNAGDWAEPDRDHLISLMAEIVADYEGAKRKTIQSAKILHNEWGWTDSAAKIRDRFLEFKNC